MLSFIFLPFNILPFFCCLYNAHNCFPSADEQRRQPCQQLELCAGAGASVEANFVDLRDTSYPTQLLRKLNLQEDPTAAPLFMAERRRTRSQAKASEVRC